VGGRAKTYGSTGYQDVQKLCSTIRKGKTMSELQELINYHKEQVEEAIASNEPEQVRLHDYLLGIARRAEAGNPIWQAEILEADVAGWQEEAIENLKESLDEAVKMTVQQVEEDYEIGLV
jgi:uncharacterized protein YjbJ (UPF0337 family)